MASFRLVLQLSTVAALLFTLEGTALATNRTVCFNLVMYDDSRVNCPQSGAGVRRVCQGDAWALNTDYMVGAVVRLWDKDFTVNPDDSLGLYYTSGPGLQRITFDWEGGGFGGGEPEPHPDLYLELTHGVTASWGDGTTIVDIVQTNGTQYPSTSFRGTDADMTFVAVDCQGSCQIFPTGAMLPYDATTDETNQARAIRQADAAQRTLEVYHDQMDNGIINIEYPTDLQFCPFGCTNSRNLIGIPLASPNDAGLITHEMGHVLQMQLFEQNTLIFECSANGAGWTAVSQEWQSCATTEGWGLYVFAVSWWNPENAGSVPVWVGTPSVDLEAPGVLHPNCGNNIWIAGQVAKSFWDLDDINNELGTGVTTGSNDVSNVATTAITAGWDVFPDGTPNARDKENNSNPQGDGDGIDENAVNMRDYNANNPVSFETFYNHNCMAGQDGG